MVVSNTIFSNLFGGHNVKPKSTNTERQAFTAKQAFIGPDAEIEDAIIKGSKPFIYTENSQNNPENSERFSSAQENSFNFSKSAPFSQAATANIAQSYVSDRSFSGSTKYGSSSGSFSSFSSSNREEARFVGRQLAFSA
jgi:hypothetical protein